jgi:hypothetical protein
MNNKRKLVIIVLVVISALLVAAFAVAQSGDIGAAAENLFGSWNTQVTTVTQGHTFPALLTFGAEGSLITDEPGAPGETSGHGNWISNADGTVSHTFIALYSDQEGNYAGRLKVVGTLQYDAGTDTWQGPFKIDGFDAQDQVAFSDTGTFDLTRIEVESMD